MTYKLELFLVIKKKRLINIKSVKNYIFFYGSLILGFSFFYTKLIHLTQKFKNLD